MAALTLGAACAGAAVGAGSTALVQRLGGGPPGFFPAAACGALFAPPAALLLRPDAWCAAAGFGSLLLSIAWLDLRVGLVHAGLAAPLALLGLIRGALTEALPAAVTGAAFGYFLCVAAEQGFRALRGRDGLGRGDAWVLGGIGAWIGPPAASAHCWRSRPAARCSPS